MLARVETPTYDFYALARYLVAGRDRPVSPNRVAWVFGQNLPDLDPDTAARFMTAAAARAPRCKAACYHMMIAWHVDERPTPETMQEIALKTLAMAGLGEHQALVMGHGDKPHAHLHIMLNRVSPVDGRAWKTSHDWRLWDGIMRTLSDEHGFAYVPSHAFNPDLTDASSKKPGRRAKRAAAKGAATNRTQWSRKQARTFSGRISDRLDRASTWEDLETLFAEDGLELEAKGKGHVVGNRSSYVKLSALGLMRTANGFAKRKVAPSPRRPMTPAPKRSVWSMDTVEFARALAAMGLSDRSAVRDAVAGTRAANAARISRLPLIHQLLADLRQTLTSWTAHTPPRQVNRRPLKRGKPANRRSKGPRKTGL